MILCNGFGFCLMDFPGKRRLIDRLVGIPQIQRALNWVRRKQGKAEFVFPGKQEGKIASSLQGR
ncbi:hypothetical protein [uncultured Desulfobulbus sp.]|uniref:hypothetical protein n=1 Tax=uncultured Desulfobulbus sp. TaxID=239745 RepID=UPI0029C92A28|nr:hypothetical protein [uncultured Desulfobulbus sp.]